MINKFRSGLSSRVVSLLESNFQLSGNKGSKNLLFYSKVATSPLANMKDTIAIYPLLAM